MDIVRAPRSPVDEHAATPQDGGTSRYADVALDALRGDGLRITRPRRSIVELLEKTSAPLTAAEIHDALKKKRILIDLASVYRTLAVLETHGLIHRLASVEGVVRCEPGFEGSACHHHLVCRACRQVKEVRCDGQHALAQRMKDESGFEVEAHRVELVGLCAACRAAAHPPA